MSNRRKLRRPKISKVVRSNPATTTNPAEIRCPECGGEVEWDAGPHVHDAHQMPHSVAWECRECGSAGVLKVDAP